MLLCLPLHAAMRHGLGLPASMHVQSPRHSVVWVLCCGFATNWVAVNPMIAGPTNPCTELCSTACLIFYVTCTNTTTCRLINLVGHNDTILWTQLDPDLGHNTATDRIDQLFSANRKPLEAEFLPRENMCKF